MTSPWAAKSNASRRMAGAMKAAWTAQDKRLGQQAVDELLEGGRIGVGGDAGRERAAGNGSGEQLPESGGRGGRDRVRSKHRLGGSDHSVQTPDVMTTALGLRQ